MHDWTIEKIKRRSSKETQKATYDVFQHSNNPQTCHFDEGEISSAKSTKIDAFDYGATC